MASGVSYEADYEGIGQILRSDEMLAVMVEAASPGLEFAQQISPVRTGRFRAGWHMETSNAGGPDHDRAEAQVVNDAVDEALADVVDHYGIPDKVLAFLAQQGDE